MEPPFPLPLPLLTKQYGSSQSYQAQRPHHELCHYSYMWTTYREAMSS